MTVTQDAVGRRVVLSPQEGLVAGGPAEEFEQRVQALFRNGSTDLLVDLRQVPTIDSRGVRALVRAHTSAQRLGATFRIACPCPAVRTILEVSKLDSVFVVYDTIDAAQKRDLRWDLVWTALAGGALCAALVAGGLRWPLAGNPGSDGAAGPGSDADALAPQPFIALIKLVAAALIGMLVTAIHAPNAADRPTGRAMQHAQILLCVSGAMMMIIIGNSLARAFGIAGAASIVRFRTPVEDPKDVTIIFLLMSLGMACGLGAFAIAGLGAAFLCVFLFVLDRTSVRRSRALAVEVIAEGRDFPTDHVQRRLRAQPRRLRDPRSLAGQGNRRHLSRADRSQPVARRPERTADGGRIGGRALRLVGTAEEGILMRLASLCLCLVTSAAGRRGGPGCAVSAAVAARRRVPRRSPRAISLRRARPRYRTRWARTISSGGGRGSRSKGASTTISSTRSTPMLRDTEHPWRDVFLNYRRFEAAEVRVGKFKVPFGRDQLASVFANSFISRSLIGSQLSPGRDIGVMVHGRLGGGTVNYSAGWFDSDGDNVRFSEDLEANEFEEAPVDGTGRRTRRALPLGGHPRVGPAPAFRVQHHHR